MIALLKLIRPLIALGMQNYICLARSKTLAASNTQLTSV